MIINWSSPSSQAVTHLVNAIYNPNTTTCALMRLLSRQGQIIADFKELDKMFLGLIDIRQQGTPQLISETQKGSLSCDYCIFCPSPSSISNLEA